MLEFDNPLEDDKEISRIQQEIDKDLSPRREEETAPGLRAEEVALEPELAPFASFADKPDAAPSYPEAEPLMSIKTDLGSAASAPKENFYSETVKYESEKRRKSRFKRALALVCVGSVLGGSMLGLGLGVGIPVAREVVIPRLLGQNPQVTVTEPAQPFTFTPVDMPAGTAAASVASDSLASIVDRIEPSVVAITSIVESAGTSYFFAIPREQQGSGSGIIFAENGEVVYIVTNYHVVNGANTVKISVQGCDPVPAKLVGREASSDLAVISVSKADLKTVGVESITLAPFGDSDGIMVGETVLAIGNALGEGNTATRGIVSAKNKEINVEDKVLKVVQTDAAINPGNSGGPLVNTSGQVIGINTAKLSDSNVEGMGYAITSNIAKPIIEELMNQKPKAFLGIQGADLTKDVATQYNLSVMAGVLVVEVVEGSSAQKAGIMRGDIITGFAGEAVLTFEQLSAAIKNCNIGDEVEVKLYRDGKNPQVLKVKLLATPETGSF